MREVDSRFESALARLDALHREDPRKEELNGQPVAYELLYAQRMSEWLERVEAAPSQALRLAVRAQHLQRWRIPRDDYPKDRPGYLAWRRDLGRIQAETAAGVLRDVGYDAQFCESVAGLIRKEHLRSDDEAQALEDTACLVFLAHYFADFAAGRDETTLLRILRKTWRKMSPHGQQLAMTIPLSTDEKALIDKALA